MALHRAHEAPDRFRQRLFVDQGAPGEVDQALLAETFTAGGTGFDHSVGEEQEPVARLQRRPGDGCGAIAQAERQQRRGVKFGGDPTSP